MKLLANMIFCLAGWLPMPVLRFLGLALAWTAHALRIRRRATLEHLAAAFPDKSPSEIRLICWRVYRHIGIGLMECLRLPATSPAKISAMSEYHDTENLDAALAKGRGALILSGHIGSWELGLAQLAAKGWKVYAVVKEIKGAFGEHVVAAWRSRHGIHTIPRRNSLREIVRALLKEKALVLFVLDQNVTANEGLLVNFFGRQACTMPGLAILAKRFQIPVVPMYSWRDEASGRHHVYCLPEVPWEESAVDDLRLNTQRYTAVLEDIIRQRPEQWLWFHRRWRTGDQEPLASETGAAAGSTAGQQ